MRDCEHGRLARQCETCDLQCHERVAHAAFMFLTAADGGPAWDAWLDELHAALQDAGYDTATAEYGHETMPPT